MIRRHLDTSLPRSWAGHPAAKGLLFEEDLRVTKASRLRAKLLVFDRQDQLRYFWEHGLERGDIGPHCPGVTNSLAQYVVTLSGFKQAAERIEYDPLYFCVIGLCRGGRWGLSHEIICHEAVHAGFYYASRCHGKRPKLGSKLPRKDIRAAEKRLLAGNFTESPVDEVDLLASETICYPAGRIAAGIFWAIDKHGLL